MTIKYYYTKPQAGVAGRATIAYVDEPHENGAVTFYAGVAYCGPKDVFCKHYGRDKARGRLVRLTTTRDGWRFMDKEPDKYLLVHIAKENRTPDDLQAFVKMAADRAMAFRPSAVVKLYGP
jgi:hypothetical protein